MHVAGAARRPGGNRAARCRGARWNGAGFCDAATAHRQGSCARCRGARWVRTGHASANSPRRHEVETVLSVPLPPPPPGKPRPEAVGEAHTPMGGVPAPHPCAWPYRSEAPRRLDASRVGRWDWGSCIACALGVFFEGKHKTKKNGGLTLPARRGAERDVASEEPAASLCRARALSLSQTPTPTQTHYSPSLPAALPRLLGKILILT